MQRLFNENIPADKPDKGNIILSFRDDDVCGKLRLYFQKEGYGVYICKSLEEFMELEHVNLKAIVIDVIPGYASTFHAIETISQLPIGSKIPILVVADVKSTQNLVRALNAGASDYILRPFSNDELLNRIESQI